MAANACERLQFRLPARSVLSRGCSVPSRMDFSAPRALSLDSSRRRPAPWQYDASPPTYRAWQACVRLIRLLALDLRISFPANFSVSCPVSCACNGLSPIHVRSGLVWLGARCLYKFHMSIHKKLPTPAFGYFSFQHRLESSKCLVDPSCPYSLLAVFLLLN